MTAAGRRPARLLRTFLLGAVLAAAMTLLGAAPAAAHTELRGSDPAPRAVVPADTAEVTLSFSGPVRAGLSTVVVTGPDGADHARGRVRARGSDAVQAVDGPLPPGAWTVAYRVVAEDGHPLTGTSSFTVRPAAVVPGVAGTLPPAPPVPARPSAAGPSAAGSRGPGLPPGADSTALPVTAPDRATTPSGDGSSAGGPIALAGTGLLVVGLTVAAAVRRRSSPRA